MADRTTKVTLTAQVSGYIAGMEKAAAATRATGTEAAKLAAKKEAFGQVGKALLAVGAVAAAAVGLAVVKFAEFDAKMSQVKTLSHATAGEMDVLTDAALNMGQAIGYSASQVADAEIELVKAGVSVKDIMGGALKGALDLAAAGQIDVAEATSIASAAMVQFGLSGKDVPHIADLLAAGADKALGGVSELGQALKYAGPVAASFGISLDETVGTLALFANNGILADQAGTGLRGVLSSLTSPSAAANDILTKYKINLFDSAGKFIGAAGAAGQLHDKLGDLDDKTRSYALGQIFGNQQITVANILMKAGAKGVREMTDEVTDQGFAAEQATGKMDNLAGDVKKLGAAFESDLIKSGSAANGTLRGVVQSVTGLGTAFGELPGPAQGAVLVIGGIVAGLALLGGGALTIIPKIAAFKVALATMSTSLRTVSLATGAVGIAITAIVTAFSLLGSSTAESKANIQALTDTLDTNTGAMTKNTKAAILKRLQDEGVYSAAKKAGISIKEVNAAVFEGGDALEKYNQKTSEYYTKVGAGTNVIRTFNGEAGALKDGVNNIRHDIDASGESWKNLSEAADDAGTNLDGTAVSVDQVASAADDATQATDDFNKALAGLGQVNLDASAANIKYNQSIADAAATTKDAGRSLEVTTEAGRKNMSALDDIASSAVALIAAQQAAGASTDTLTTNMGAARTAFINAAIAAGATTDQANALADQYGLIPKNVDTAFNTTGAGQAIAAAAAVKAAYDAITRNLEIHVKEIFTPDPTAPSRGIKGNASGGAIIGAGGPKDDRLLRRLSNGEHVLTAEDVDAMGGQQGVYRFRASLHGGGGGAYVPASYQPAPPRTEYASAASGGSGRGDTHFTINEVTDPIGTANAVFLRQNRLGAV